MPSAPERKRILLVDDNAELRFVWKRVLTSAGFEVQEAANGADGLEQARAWRPDVILMDISMPVLDGIQATTRLKADPATASIPVIVISGEMDAAERTRASRCDMCLTKPIRNQQLLSAIRELLAGSETREAEAAAPAGSRGHSA
jgi:CheY-like chemotaxis protein